MKINAAYCKLRRYIMKKCGVSSKYVSKIGSDAPWAFISYIPEAIHFAFDEAYLVGHQSRREMAEIVKAFNNKGYNVYCVDFSEEDIPNINFDVVFGLEPAYVKACEANPEAVKIYYATGAYSGHQNASIKSRTDSFNRRYKANYEYQRLVPEREFLSHTDYVLQIGSRFTVETYPEVYRNRIRTIHQSSTARNDIDKNKKDYSNKKDILWIGGGGEILKGLDLLLETLQHKDYRLHIVGNVSDEFKAFFSTVKNIHYYGFLNINSDLFKEICERCNFLIYPSCTEGGAPGAVINSMRMGVIPVVSRWAAFDEIEDYGYLLEDLTDEAIEKALTWMDSLDSRTVETLSNRCIGFSKETYSLSRFAKEFRKYLDEVLGNGK